MGMGDWRGLWNELWDPSPKLEAMMGGFGVGLKRFVECFLGAVIAGDRWEGMKCG